MLIEVLFQSRYGTYPSIGKHTKVGAAGWAADPVGKFSVFPVCRVSHSLRSFGRFAARTSRKMRGQDPLDPVGSAVGAVDGKDTANLLAAGGTTNVPS